MPRNASGAMVRPTLAVRSGPLAVNVAWLSGEIGCGGEALDLRGAAEELVGEETRDGE